MVWYGNCQGLIHCEFLEVKHRIKKNLLDRFMANGGSTAKDKI